MPLEIKELIIKAVVGEEPQNSNTGSTGNKGGSIDPEMMEVIVEKVLEILAKKAER